MAAEGALESDDEKIFEDIVDEMLRYFPQDPFSADYAQSADSNRRMVLVPVTIDCSTLAPKFGVQASEWSETARSVAQIMRDELSKAPLKEQSFLQNLSKVALTRALATEMEHFVDAYRDHLRRSFTQGDDPVLKKALNRVRLQNDLLESTTLVDQKSACELLGKSPSNASAAMKRVEIDQALLKFNHHGRVGYPLFQFDIDNRRIFPLIKEIRKIQPDDYSDFMLLHWLTRPHLDFDGPPADALKTDPDAVLEAFSREVEPVLHG
ncbi:hypothetical protein [Croceicoccus gelatinilyticus]|uniref:hypothetical protein n=1 Tax=Croceicoccus gelatinilyticus TaxID=2835536 RepID=UPI001BCCAF17|nr:hypothetical protein [Croceicoccus gelatinilyticus]MBS7671610.1 hypothetical protein [Croceicoccus gelatinilyticus]